MHNRGYHFEWKENKKSFVRPPKSEEFRQEKPDSRVDQEAENNVEFTIPDNSHPVIETADAENQKQFLSKNFNKITQQKLTENLTIENDDTLYINTAEIKGYKEPTPKARKIHSIFWFLANLIFVTLLVIAVVFVATDAFIGGALAAAFVIILGLPALLLLNIIFSNSRPERVAERKIKSHLRKLEEESKSPEQVQEERKESRKRMFAVLGILAGLWLTLSLGSQITK